MKLPKLALPNETLGSALGDSRTRYEDQRDDRNNDEGNADGEDEEEVSGNEFVFGEGISVDDVSLCISKLGASNTRRTRC
jgi:hypothetical protein